METQQLQVSHVRIKDKRVTYNLGLKIEIKITGPSGVFKLHKATSEDLVNTFDDQEKENSEVRKRIAEMEVTLNPNLLFMEPLVVIVPHDFSK